MLSDCTSVFCVYTLDGDRVVLGKRLCILFRENLTIFPRLNLFNFVAVGPNPDFGDKRVKLNFQVTLLIVSCLADST